MLTGAIEVFATSYIMGVIYLVIDVNICLILLFPQPGNNISHKHLTSMLHVDTVTRVLIYSHYMGSRVAGCDTTDQGSDMADQDLWDFEQILHKSHSPSGLSVTVTIVKPRCEEDGFTSKKIFFQLCLN